MWLSLCWGALAAPVVVRTVEPLEEASAAARGFEPLVRPGARVAPERFVQLGLDRLYRVDTADLEALRTDRLVEEAWPDTPIHPTHQPSDPQFAEQWAPERVKLTEAWDRTTGGGAVIALIDDGIERDHPDLAPALWVNVDEVDGNYDDDDGNGYVNDVHGWNFTRGFSYSWTADGHATATGGILAARGDDEGMVGACWDCTLMDLKVFTRDGGQASWLAEAIVYATDNGADLINMSLSSYVLDPAVRDAVLYAHAAGIPMVASTGNEGLSDPGYPAAFPEVIAVGATNADDQRANPFFDAPGSGSNWGDHVDLVAPGDLVWTADGEDSWIGWQGTSFSTPLVAGTVALMLALDPDLTPAQVQRALQLSARDQLGDPTEDVPGWDPYYGWGLLDADAALDYADPSVDGDGDGHTIDCDDTLPQVHPGAADPVGDGLDSNCDGVDGQAPPPSPPTPPVPPTTNGSNGSSGSGCSGFSVLGASLVGGLPLAVLGRRRKA